MALRIPDGDRPRHEDIDVGQADGLKDMVDLMTALWDVKVAKRPTFKGFSTSWVVSAAVFD